ncbi:MAG: hypothetical protein GX549_04775 [Clostridiales bacterium]|nr:hypothetical protein [Clostridiales bacterium]
MNLNSPVRLTLRLAASALVFACAARALYRGVGILPADAAGGRMLAAAWLLLLADLLAALVDRTRWQSPGGGTAYTAERLARVRREERRILAWALVIWAAILTGGLLTLRLTPLTGDWALIAVAALIPAEAVFSRWRCPFSRWLTHSPCCRICRLRDWGEAMVLSPLCALPSPLTFALIALSLAVLVRGELIRRAQPCPPDCGSCPGPCVRRERR